MDVTKSSTVLAPAQFIYDWHTNLAAFDRLLPPWQSIDIHKVNGSFENRTVEFSLKKMGISIEWHAKHSQVVPGQQFYDHQVKGPFRMWRHGHFFKSIANSRTKMMDHIEFELPFHIVSGILSGWRIKQELTKLLDYRHQQVIYDLNLLYSKPLNRSTIAISGSSGMIGNQLIKFLSAAGHNVKRMVRSKKPLDNTSVIAWNPEEGILDDYSDVSIIVHLAGEPIASPIRWSDSKKKNIYNSRVHATKVLCQQLANDSKQVHTFICASAIGAYPDSNVSMIESSKFGDGFLSEVVHDWELATDPIRNTMRVCNARFGTILHPFGGVMKRLGPLMKCGVLGAIGSGKQYVSWIGLDDAVRALYFMMANSAFVGPINVVSPKPQSQLEWIKDWGRAMIRPTSIPLPEFAVDKVMDEI